MGTPEFAVVSLKSLLNDPHYEIVGVITQPDRPAGRKLQLTPSPVKTLALEHGLKVITPESLKKSDPSVIEEIRNWKAEVGIVVAFGQILTEDFMGIFPLGCVNVHGSILPEWRGAAPIQRAIEAGDVEGGVTLQKMVKKLDAGDVIGVRKAAINDEINALEWHDQLAVLGADLLHVELMDYVRGNLAPTPQDESKVTIAKKIDKAESQIDWKQSAKAINGKIRGFCYGPGTYTFLQGKKIKLHRAKVISASVSAEPGTLVEVAENDISVATGDGILKIFELQPESRTRMGVKEFLKGHELKKGDRLG